MKQINILTLLKRYDFVSWDRYIVMDKYIFIYGWIDRKKDSYKDFILIHINKSTGNFKVITSSFLRHDEIFSLIDVKSSPNCQRVEDTWDIPNSIKLANI